MEKELVDAKSELSDISRTQTLLNTWLKQEQLWKKMSGWERTLMAKKAGRWTAQERSDASWQIEAAGCIAWALGTAAMPAYDAEFAPKQVLSTVPDQGLPTHEWIAAASLQEEKIIREQREIVELWLWRSRKEMILRNPNPPFSQEAFQQRIRRAIVNAATQCESWGWFQMIEGDFPARGKPYAQLVDADWHGMGNIATMRLQALNWLCGQERDWDSISCDT
jgi:hypothetical protein